MTEDQIKHMANRFLGWKLPEDFHPDAGIKFSPHVNPGCAYDHHRDGPIGTNLLNATQAEAMVRFMAEGLPAADRIEALTAENERLREALVRLRDCDWVITPLDRMDAVRNIARAALENK